MMPYKEIDAWAQRVPTPWVGKWDTLVATTPMTKGQVTSGVASLATLCVILSLLVYSIMRTPPTRKKELQPTKNWTKRGHIRAEPERRERVEPSDESGGETTVIVVVKRG